MKESKYITNQTRVQINTQESKFYKITHFNKHVFLILQIIHTRVLVCVFILSCLYTHKYT